MRLRVNGREHEATLGRDDTRLPWAIFAATGERIRRLPLTEAGFS